MRLVSRNRLELSMAATAASYPPIPELRAPKDLFNNVVNIGATKAKLGSLKTFLLGIKSGCHISFGERDTDIMVPKFLFPQ